MVIVMLSFKESPLISLKAENSIAHLQIKIILTYDTPFALEKPRTQFKLNF